MIFAANWKMHVTPSEARSFAEVFLRLVPLRPGRETWFFPSAVSLATTVRAFRDRSDIRCGVQDVHPEPKGAFTGATSVPLAASAGATVALVGHSERRHVFGETDEETGKKVRASIDRGLTPVLCVGETLAQRESGETMAMVLRQLRSGCDGLSANEAARVVVAYEPVWAIGTGRNATPEDAARVHALIRATLTALGATSPSILYGGSVNPSNIGALMAQSEVDGVLVGGASLDPDRWAGMVMAGYAATGAPSD